MNDTAIERRVVMIGSAAMRTWTLAVAIAAFGCGGGYPDPKPDRPDAPTTNDPAFSSHGLQSWYLIGDGATPGEDQLTFIITAPSGTDFVDAYIPGLPPQRMIDQDDGFALDISIANLEAGAHEILFSANGSDSAFAAATLNRSAPYYVLVSTDYDFSDPGNLVLGQMDQLHTNHPGMVITHFWAPYTYTDPQVTDARRDELTTWIKKARDTNHDEIALHIHPYCNFVEDAGLTCITDQSTVYTTDVTGYTIKLSAYERAPMGKLLQHAATIFEGRGLGTPITFRAGGWTADLNTLLALADNGYIADTSALNWKYIEEWQGKELYTWNMTHWGPINDTSQPYYPSTTDALASAPAGANIALLEVPDNGVMIDYVSTPEMSGIFDANWDGAPFAAAKTLMMGFHPSTSFSQAEYKRVDDFLKYADTHVASKDLGPVVYISLTNVTKAFPAQ
jgi:hypothetical protein